MRVASIITPIVVVLVLFGLTALPMGYAQTNPGSTASYLPQVFRAADSSMIALSPTVIPTPTATSTAKPLPTPSPTPVPVTLLPNGDFEQGNTVWTANNTTAITIPTGIVAHSGKHVLTLNTQNGSADIISQRTTVPEGAVFLSFWIWIVSDTLDCGIERYSVSVYDTYGSKQTLEEQSPVCGLTATEGWHKVTMDAGAYENQRITIMIEGDIAKGSTVHIDDMGWQSTP